MTGWPIRPLHEIAAIRHGGTPSKSVTDYWRGNIPWVSPKDMGPSELIDTQDHISAEGVSDSATSVVPEGSLLVVARSGVLAHSVPIARILRPMAFNQDIKAITVNPEIIDAAYLSWFLRSQEKRILLQGVKRGATVHSLQSGYVEGYPIPLPPLLEQRRIVDILNHANSVRRLRREAQEKARQVIPALFVEMFGDPGKNPKGWLSSKLGELGTLDRGRSRHRPRNDPRLLGGPYPFVQTGDVANSGGSIKKWTATYSEFGLAQSRMWPVGTLCITIAANIAMTGILNFEACFPDSVVGFIPGPDVHTSYIQGVIDRLQATLEAAAPQLAQKNINLEILRALPVPVPPLRLQTAFADRLADIHCIIAQQDRSYVRKWVMTG